MLTTCCSSCIPAPPAVTSCLNNVAGPNSMAGSGAGPSGSYGSSGSGAAGVGSGSGAASGTNAWGMHAAGNNSMAAGGQGTQKWGLLAQYQGSYGPMYALGGYGGGYGHAGGYGAHHHHHHMGQLAKQLLSAQFMPEGLRQQLQQSNYLIQLQVRFRGPFAGSMDMSRASSAGVPLLVCLQLSLLSSSWQSSSTQQQPTPCHVVAWVQPPTCTCMTHAVSSLFSAASTLCRSTHVLPCCLCSTLPLLMSPPCPTSWATTTRCTP